MSSNVASKCRPARRDCLNLRDNVEEARIDHILLFTVNNPVTPVRRSSSGTPIYLAKKIVLKLLLRLPVFAHTDAFDYSVELLKCQTQAIDRQGKFFRFASLLRCKQESLIGCGGLRSF